ncbi:permease-like cell division protein FtsX [Algivirga pacifica]|uniref:Cell division protein FtsX n=2 Tax=Algivirga pacifica TaxID=1162670 RepID=A0ABP9D817_9BACT
MSSALFMIGLMLLFLNYARILTEEMQNAVEMQVVLKKGILEERIQKVGKSLSSKPYISKKHPITFTSREDVAAKVKAETGEDFMQLLDENPLRDIYTIIVRKEFLTPTHTQQIVAELSRMEEVHEVIYTPNLIKEIRRNVTNVSKVLGVLALAFILTSIFLINNSIKLALYSQRFLIRSMQLVGATNGFIKKPFLWRACYHGIIGGSIATLLIVGLQYMIQYSWPEIQEISDYYFTGLIFVSLVLSGILIGTLSVYGAISKYLKMRLDDLY